MARKSKIKFLEKNGVKWSHCYSDPSTCSTHNHKTSRELAKVLSKNIYDVSVFDTTVVEEVNGEEVSYRDYIVVTADRHEVAFDCKDCGINTLYSGEYYMVEDYIWDATQAGSGMLCIGCLENRIGRKLQSSDFSNAPLNKDGFGMKSERLQKRLGLM